MTKFHDFLIIGGGAIGLSLAWRLQQGGASVGVLDTGRFLRSPTDKPAEGQATTAAAGMLAPYVGTAENAVLFGMALSSFLLWPRFAEELTAASGIDVALEGHGVLRLARTEEESTQIETQLARQPEELPLYHLDRSQLLELEPALSPGYDSALFSPAERRVDPWRLLHALTAAAERAGVHLYDQLPAQGFTHNGSRVEAVLTEQGSFSGGDVVLAGGAWSGGLAEQLGLELPVRPVRGQMAALHAPGVVRHALFADSGCLIPRDDGQVMVGSTEENAGFESHNTAEGVAGLLRFASDVVPALAQASFQSAWSGFRPAAPDGLPILGPVSGWSNLHIATGHFKKGILVTPITAQWMCGWLLRRHAQPMADFTPGRFNLRAE